MGGSVANVSLCFICLYCSTLFEVLDICVFHGSWAQWWILVLRNFLYFSSISWMFSTCFCCCCCCFFTYRVKIWNSVPPSINLLSRISDSDREFTWRLPAVWRWLCWSLPPYWTFLFPVIFTFTVI